jgi:FkbM family methyltransferase
LTRFARSARSDRLRAGGSASGLRRLRESNFAARFDHISDPQISPTRQKDKPARRDAASAHLKTVNFSGISHSSLLGRALRFPLCLLSPEARIPVLQGPLRGKRWIVGSSNHGCWLGSYEYAKQRIFSALIRPGDTVFDLGANVGFYTLLASILVGPEGRVYSFEPVPRNLHYLRAHLDLNRIRNCSVWPVAVGRSEGTGYFDPGPDHSMGHLRTDTRSGLTVRTVSLDALIARGELPPPAVIKCDIEGGEAEALAGARETLTAYAPTIFLATHGRDIHRNCCGFLTDIGYHLTALGDADEILAVRRNQC